MTKFELAHFNPKELDELNSWQGGKKLYPGSKDLHDLSGVEKLLSNPENEKKIMTIYEGHAKGGRIGDLLRDADRMRHKGRNGDNEMAMIGPHTERIFNRILGGRCENPATRKPEYFNLGGFLGGIGKTFTKGLGSMGGHLMNAIPGAIQGGMMAGPEGALAGGGASLLGGMMGGNKKRAPSTLSNLGSSFMNSPMGQNAMNSNYGQMAQNMGNQMQGMYNQGKQLYNQGQQFMNSPTGQSMMNSPTGQRMQQAAQPYMQQGQDMYNQAQNAYGQGRQMYNNANNAYSNMISQGKQYNQQPSQSYDPEGGMFDMGGQNMYGQ
jgi:hypothetical protein